jgi:multicomponent Na+:H+ antiporter subunit D
MGAGSVLQVTGLRKLSEMGGLYRTMPRTLTLYMVGAFAISAVPLFSGFVSKAMVVSAAAESHMPWVFLVLTLASAGTFLHTGLKLPYYMFFGVDRGLPGKEPPPNMLAAMGVAAAACILIGIVPALLYSALPHAVEYAPYTVRHVTATLGLLGFTALGFFLLLTHLDPEPTISLDTDWFYRRGASAVLGFAGGGLARAQVWVGNLSDVVMQRLVLGTASTLRNVDLRGVDAGMVGVGGLTEALSRVMSTAVTGHAQHYALVMAAGVLAAIVIAVFGW